MSRATGVGGEKSNGWSFGLLSGNGRFVAFASGANNLDQADRDSSVIDVFLRDLALHRTVLVSRGSGADGPKANSNSAVASVSQDGRYVAFRWCAWNLDKADLAVPKAGKPCGADVYVRDVESEETALVSRADGADGPKANGSSSRGLL